MPTASSLPNAWIPYIKIQMATISLSQSAIDGKPDYFMSLTHELPSENAGKLNLTITFAPSYLEGPNMIEEAIVASKGEAIVSYGFIRGWTRNYKCLIHNCIPKIDNGQITYQLSCISKAVIFNFSKVSESPIKEAAEVIPMMETIVNKYCIDDEGAQVYFFDSSSCSQDFSIPDKGIPVNGRSPIKTLQIIAQNLTCLGSSNFRYMIEVDDSYGSSPGHIRLLKVDPEQASTQFTFDWGTRKGTVLSWTPQWDMSVAIFASRAGAGQQDADYDPVINPDTKDINTAVSSVSNQLLNADDNAFSPSEPLAQANKAITSKDNWIKYAEYCYQGTLSVIGEPVYAPIGHSVIEIRPYLGGQLHHSAGKYIVMGVTNNVSSSGFTTDYKVSRLMDDSQLPYNNESSSDYIWHNGVAVPYSEFDPYDEGA